jgi:hypothetical protein
MLLAYAVFTIVILVIASGLAFCDRGSSVTNTGQSTACDSASGITRLVVHSPSMW